jgi:hypothetical protein
MQALRLPPGTESIAWVASFNLCPMISVFQYFRLFRQRCLYRILGAAKIEQKFGANMS